MGLGKFPSAGQRMSIHPISHAAAFPSRLSDSSLVHKSEGLPHLTCCNFSHLPRCFLPGPLIFTSATHQLKQSVLVWDLGMGAFWLAVIVPILSS